MKYLFGLLTFLFIFVGLAACTPETEPAAAPPTAEAESAAQPTLPPPVQTAPTEAPPSAEATLAEGVTREAGPAAASPPPVETAADVCPIRPEIAAQYGPGALDSLTAYRNEANGFCLYFPDTFAVSNEITNAPMGGGKTGNIIEITGPPLDDSAEPLLAHMNIVVTVAETNSLDDLVAQYVAQTPYSSMESITLGGAPAKLLRGVPARTETVQIIALYQSLAYHMVFAPVDPNFPQAEPDVNALMTAVINTWTFLGEGGMYGGAPETAAPPPGEMEPAIYVDPVYGYSLAYPATFYDLGGQAAEHYFATQSQAELAEGPMALAPDNLWVTVRVLENPAQQPLADWLAANQMARPEAQAITINDLPAIRQVEDSTGAPGIEGGYAVSTYLASGDKVYQIQALTSPATSTADSFNRYASAYDLMTYSFNLNQAAAPPAPPSSPETAVCPIPPEIAAQYGPDVSSSLAAYRSDASGFCLYYPNTFTVGDEMINVSLEGGKTGNIVEINGPPLDNSQEPVAAYLNVVVTGAEADTLDALVAQHTAQTPYTSRESITLGGVPAELFRGVPGRTQSIQILTLYHGVSYLLTFAPVDPNFPQAEPDVNMLMTAVINTWTFLGEGGGPGAAAPPETGAPPPGEMEPAIYVDPVYGYSLAYPPTFYDLGGQAAEHYFATQSQAELAEGPMSLPPDNLWVTVRVLENPAQQPLADWLAANQMAQPEAQTLTINGLPAIRQVEDSTGASGMEGAYAVSTYLAKGDKIYQIQALTSPATSTADSFNLYADAYDLIVNSFIVP